MVVVRAVGERVVSCTLPQPTASPATPWQQLQYSLQAAALYCLVRQHLVRLGGLKDFSKHSRRWGSRVREGCCSSSCCTQALRAQVLVLAGAFWLLQVQLPHSSNSSCCCPTAARAASSAQRPEHAREARLGQRAAARPLPLLPHLPQGT